MKDKYKILKELINGWIERETENLHESAKSGGDECPGAGMAIGAIEAYEQVLSDIAELEFEVQE